MSSKIVGSEWRKVKKELLGNLDELSSKEAENKDIYILMKELVEKAKLKPSGGPKSGETKTVL
jgi:hypothetical protein